MTQEVKINFSNLSVTEANLIIGALAKQPFEMVADLVVKLQQQAQGQYQAATKAAEVPDEV